MADVATVAEENIVGVHVVKSFAQEQAEQDKFERRSEALFAQSVRANRQRAFYVPAARASCRCSAQAAVLLVGGEMVVRRARFRSATSSRFNLYLSMVVFPLRMLGMWIGEGQRATASGERIFQVIDEPEEIRDRPGARRRCPPGPGAVRFEDVTFGYDPDRPGPARDRPRARAREDRRADRPHRRGQDDARLADPALLRRPGGARARSTAPTSATSRSTSLRREIGVIAQDPFLFSATRAREPHLRPRRRRPTRRSARRRGSPRRTSSSSGCPTATRR